MPTPAVYKAPFYYGAFYHLVFKSIDGVPLFRSDENKQFFLDRFPFFLHMVFTCWSWILLDNHTHFVIRVREVKDMYKRIVSIPETERTVSMKQWISDVTKETSPDELIERQVNRFMVSYTNAYNNLYKRKGALFQSPFRRSVISGDAHLQQAIIYTHANAQKHGLATAYDSYYYSSYQEIITGRSAFTDCQAVLQFFGGKEQFIQQHREQAAHFYLQGDD